MNKITLLFLFIIPFQIAFSQELLFNGKDLSGWIVNGTEKWYVEDGLLVCESGPEKNYGYLTTEKNFKDFILDLEFKQESNGNSDVFLDQEANQYLHGDYRLF